MNVVEHHEASRDGGVLLFKLLFVRRSRQQALRPYFEAADTFCHLINSFIGEKHGDEAFVARLYGLVSGLCCRALTQALRGRRVIMTINHHYPHETITRGKKSLKYMQFGI